MPLALHGLFEMTPQTNEALLRLPVVQARTGLSRSQIYALIRAGGFPAPVPLVGRTRAWTESSVSAWIAGRIAAAGNSGAQ